MLAVALNSVFGQSTETQVLQASAIACAAIFIYMLSSYRWQGRLVGLRILNCVVHDLTSLPKLDHIPAVGSSAHWLSFIGAAEFLFNARGVVQRGYDQVSIGITAVIIFILKENHV
jgi:uncharacterized protein involved in tolerance to divalent cations